MPVESVKELIEDVKDLSELMLSLAYSSVFFESKDIAESSKMVGTAAKNLSEGVLQGRKMHPIIKDAIRESDESIVRCVVTDKSIMKNKTLADLKIRTDVGMQIIA